MIKNKLAQGILNLITICAMVAGIAGGCLFLTNDLFVRHADASFGQVTLDIPATENATGFISIDYGNLDWQTIHDASTSDYMTATPSWVEPMLWTNSSHSNKWASLHRGVCSWDLTGDNISLSDIVSVTVKLHLDNQQNTFTSGDAPECSIYTMSMPPYSGYGGDTSTNDYDNLNTGIRVSSEVCGYNEYGNGTWVSFPIMPEYYDNILLFDHDCAYVSVNLLNDALNFAPTFQYDRIMDFWFDGGTSVSYKPVLEIVYNGVLPERVVVTTPNAPVDTSVTGNETADNITWVSPRCAYDDEAVAFDVAGESGAVINLRLLDKNGAIIASHTDSVRTNGHYYYTTDLPDTCRGALRLIEAKYNIKSEWGWSALSPDSAEADPYTYALYTEYPQYDVAFKDYVVKSGDYLIFHWKTRITTDEYNNASLRIWYLNDSTKEVYNHTLWYLNANYYLSSANNTGLASWRYAVFALNSGGSGWSDYDGIVINLNRPFDYNTEGFYTASIYHDGTGEFAIPQSACWYLNSANDGVATSLNNAEYSAGQDITASLGVGDASKVKTDLNTFRIYLIDKDGQNCGSKMTEVSTGETDLVIPAPQTAGDYKARFILMKSGKSYEYIHDVSFTVSGGTGGGGTGGSAGDIIGMIQNTLAKMHLNSKAGHWLALIIGMVALFLIFMKSGVLRIIMPSLLFCAACVFGWIDIWYIALIALLDGFLIFGAINRRLHGGGGDGED